MLLTAPLFTSLLFDYTQISVSATVYDPVSVFVSDYTPASVPVAEDLNPLGRKLYDPDFLL
jgi:hypothetical protein